MPSEMKHPYEKENSINSDWGHIDSPERSCAPPQMTEFAFDMLYNYEPVKDNVDWRYDSNLGRIYLSNIQESHLRRLACTLPLLVGGPIIGPTFDGIMFQKQNAYYDSKHKPWSSNDFKLPMVFVPSETGWSLLREKVA